MNLKKTFDETVFSFDTCPMSLPISMAREIYDLMKKEFEPQKSTELAATTANSLKAEVRALLSNCHAMSTIEFYAYIDNHSEQLRELSAV